MTAPTTAPAPAETPTQPTGDQSPPPGNWRGLLVPFNSVSGDGRMIEPPSGTLRVRPLPLPLLNQPTLEDEHNGSVVVGTIDEVTADDAGIWGRGRFDLADATAADTARRVADGFLRGISVDLDDVTVETRCL